MTRLRLLCGSTLLAASAACAGHHGGAPSPKAAVNRALVGTYGQPNVLRVSQSMVHIEYGVNQATGAQAGAAQGDPFLPLAVRIARAALEGYGRSAPVTIEIVLNERRDGMMSGTGRPLATFQNVPHHYLFGAAEIAGR